MFFVCVCMCVCEKSLPLTLPCLYLYPKAALYHIGYTVVRFIVEVGVGIKMSFLHINLVKKNPKSKSSKEAHQNFMCSCLDNPYWPVRVIFPRSPLWNSFPCICTSSDIILPSKSSFTHLSALAWLAFEAKQFLVVGMPGTLGGLATSRTSSH